MKEQQLPNGFEIVKKQIGEWENNIGPDITATDGTLVRYLEQQFARFRGAYQPAQGLEYFFFTETGFPSPIIRVDMPLIVQDVSPVQGFFEIESRPAGLGIDSALFPEHRERLSEYIDILRRALDMPLAVKMFPYSQNPRHDPSGEKREFAQQVGIPFFDVGEQPDEIDDFLYFVYGNTGANGEVEAFERRSLFPVRDDGNKDYLVSMGAASVADRIAVSKKIGLGVPFVLKPRKGMWAQDVVVYPGEEGRARFDGFASERDIHALIGQPSFPDRYLCQSFFNPGQVRFGKDPYLAMARVYAFANLRTGRYEVSNGIYVARQNIRLHGTADAVTGKLVIS